MRFLCYRPNLVVQSVASSTFHDCFAKLLYSSSSRSHPWHILWASNQDLAECADCGQSLQTSNSQRTSCLQSANI